MPSSTAVSVLTQWTFLANRKCSPIVIPDGCVDFIVKLGNRNRSAMWFLSDLSERSYSVGFCEGDAMFGLRLQPGAIVDATAIEAWTKRNDSTDLFAGDQFDEFCHVPVSITEALKCLASGMASVNDVAKELAVSTRTLQREVGKHTGRSPHFWLALARIRRTCRSLHKFDRLTDAAAAFGFADQSHMSREVARWFDVTPSSITVESDVFDQLQQSGYG